MATRGGPRILRIRFWTKTHTSRYPEQIGRNGEAFVPEHTTWDGPLVDSKKITKIEGKTIDFAYDSHMQSLENFAKQLEAGETLEG